MSFQVIDFYLIARFCLRRERERESERGTGRGCETVESVSLVLLGVCSLFLGVLAKSVPSYNEFRLSLSFFFEDLD